MADIVTVQELQDASLDVQTLEQFVNGDENAVNKPRLLPNFDIGSIAELRKKVQAKVDLQIAALPSGRKGYKTYAEAQVAQASLPANTVVEVNNDSDTVKNGVYTWDGTTLVKSNNDVLGQAKSYSDSNIAKVLTVGKNLYDGSKKQINKFINSGSGNITISSEWACSDYIPVAVGKSYTVSSTSRRVGLAFYDANKAYIANSYSGGADSLTVTAPTNASYLVINIDSNTVMGTNVQVEQGTTATSYEPNQLVLRQDVSKNVVAKSELNALVTPLVTKPYEVVMLSKNLFDTNNVVANSYLDSTDGRVITSASGGGS